MTHPDTRHDTEDADIDRVLRAAGRRTQPPEDVERTVREAVHGEWKAVVDARRAARRKRSGLRSMIAVAAGIVAVALAIWLNGLYGGKPAYDVASIARVSGSVTSDGGIWSRAQAVKEHQLLRAGDELVTGADGRAALDFGNGVSVRLDHGTRIELADTRHLVVLAGAVYVDAQTPSTGGEHLRVETPVGAVHHVGTQYEVRLIDPEVRIRVREGAVELVRQGGAIQRGEAGEQLTISPGGRMALATVPAYGAEWSWVGEAAPSIDIDGRPLPQFLAWAARELGREIVYGTPESEAEAARVTLSGSVEDLSPAEALAAVLSTTRLRSIERDGQLVILIEPGPQ